MKSEITLEETKKLLLEMLTEIDTFCQQKKIRYFLVGGTLLGAIRHNGFIPWDDDIDIGFPREDYNRFLKEFVSTSGHIKVIDFHNKENYIWSAAKAVDERTVLIENGNKKQSIGIFIDIFPLDKVAGSLEVAKKKQKKINFWKNMLTLKYLRMEKDRSIVKNLAVLLGKLLFVVPDKRFLMQIEKLSTNDINCDDCEYVCNFSGAWGEREIVKQVYFENIEQHKFEGHMFNIPSKYDAYLKTIYGDYMTLPPVEKRISHHGNVAYWKN